MATSAEHAMEKVKHKFDQIRISESPADLFCSEEEQKRIFPLLSGRIEVRTQW